MDHYTLKLYVTGRTPRSLGALQTLERICEKRLAGRYVIHLVDLSERPELAQECSVIATPTLVREFPLTEKRLVGDFSREEEVVLGLDLPALSPVIEERC